MLISLSYIRSIGNIRSFQTEPNQKDYEHIYKYEVWNGDLELRICNWLNGSLWIVVREAYLDAGCFRLR